MPKVTFHEGRMVTKAERMKALRRGLKLRQQRLERSMAMFREKGREPRPGDRERWAAIRAEIRHFEKLLAEVAADGEPPLSERTGEKTRHLPDRLGGDEDHGQ